ncbi:MAG: hypothetical protein R3C44_05390 [Chloroflexota bacterium]
MDVTAPEQPVAFTLSDNVEKREGETLVWIGIPPIVDTAPARQTVAVGQPVRLAAGRASGPGPISELWDLGDGRRLTVNPRSRLWFPRRVHLGPASNPAGRVRRQLSVNVVASPVAGFLPDDDTPGVGQSVAFRNLSGGQPPLRVSWEFGDGTSGY